MGRLPHIACVISRPRQTTDLGYRLRDWQAGFGGFTKVYEYGDEQEVKRMYSAAYVIKPRTERENAYLCLSLMSKPWSRNPDLPDPSMSVVLDSQDMSEWCVQSVVEPKLLKPTSPLMVACRYVVYHCLGLTPRAGCTGRCPRFLLSGTLMGFQLGVGNHRLSLIICVPSGHTRAGLVTALGPGERKALLQDQTTPGLVSFRTGLCVRHLGRV